MKIGLFFGSFNPIHFGHLIIANAILTKSNLGKIWFVVSPHNPLKKKTSLLHIQDRIKLVREAIYDNYNFEICDIEARMKMPSYTINTLTLLDEKYPNYEFSLIIGEDNLASLNKWKNYEEILKRYKIFAFPRINVNKTELYKNDAITLIEAPIISISSSYIRKCVKNGYSIKYLTPSAVVDMIKADKFYE